MIIIQDLVGFVL